MRRPRRRRRPRALPRTARGAEGPAPDGRGGGRLKSRAERPFRFHVVGEGHLQASGRAAGAASRGLEAEVRFHPPAADARPWYRGLRPAADDEQLRGRAVRDLRGARHGRSRRGAGAAGQPRAHGRRRRHPHRLRAIRTSTPPRSSGSWVTGSCRDRLGESGRRRMLEDFSLRQMAESHERLYERLLETGTPRERRRARRWPSASFPEQLRFRGSPLRGQPLVSVVDPDCTTTAATLRSALAIGRGADAIRASRRSWSTTRPRSRPPTGCSTELEGAPGCAR